MKRQPRGQANGGQFAPDTSGRAAPTPNDIPRQPSADTEPTGLPLTALYSTFQEATHVHIDDIPPLPSEEEPKQVIVIRGIPGSGKSTWTRKVVDAYPPGAVVRINNDDLCTMLYGSSRGGGENTGAFLHEVRKTLLENALANPDVRMVIIDNTNLAVANLNQTFKVANTLGATMTVDDRFLSVPVEECIRRNAARENPVPDDVIRRMAQQIPKAQKWTPPPGLPHIEPYHNDPNLPHVFIFDVDGTLANMSPDRGPFEWHKVGLDSVNEPVAATLRGLLAQGKSVKVFSGRSEECRQETQAWLDEHVAPGLELHMRPAKDNRGDHLVKLDLFNEQIRDKFHVSAVYDDRDQVVDLWRRKLGLPTFQVADGNF